MQFSVCTSGTRPSLTLFPFTQQGEPSEMQCGTSADLVDVVLHQRLLLLAHTLQTITLLLTGL